MYIVEIKGKQYEVNQEGDKLTVDHIDQDEGSSFSDIKVLYHRRNEKEVNVGTPYLENIKMTAKVESSFKDKKVNVIHYKPKTRIYSKRGHRQEYSKIVIEKISA